MFPQRTNWAIEPASSRKRCRVPTARRSVIRSCSLSHQYTERLSRIIPLVRTACTDIRTGSSAERGLGLTWDTFDVDRFDQYSPRVVPEMPGSPCSISEKHVLRIGPP